MWRDQKAIERLEDRLRSLEIKCDDLDRVNKKLDMEFTELYDKTSHMMSRIAKRTARAAADTPPNGEASTDESPSDQIDPISRSIMLRRGGAGVTK